MDLQDWVVVLFFFFFNGAGLWRHQKHDKSNEFWRVSQLSVGVGKKWMFPEAHDILINPITCRACLYPLGCLLFIGK